MALSVVSYLFAYGLLLASGVIILRLVVRRDYLRRGQLSFAVATLQALLFFAYGGFPYLYLAGDWPATHVNQFAHLFGLGAIFVGLGFLFYGMIVLGLLPSMGRGRNGLAQTGIYRVSRNPQALACGLYVLGFTVLWPSWFAVGWAILYAILIHIMIITEEEHLLRTYGEGYAAYCRDVPRYLSLRSWIAPETAI